MEEDDPWHWDTDRIVREFCTSGRTWPDRSRNQRLPEPVSFERVLRKHHIAGDGLLVDMTDSILKHEWGIEVFTERATLNHAIRELRLMSRRYAEYTSRFRYIPSMMSESSDSHRDPQDSFLDTLAGGLAARLGVTLSTPRQPTVGAEHSRLEQAAEDANRSEGATDRFNDRLLVDTLANGTDFDLAERQAAEIRTPEAESSEPTVTGSLPAGKVKKRIAPTLLTTNVSTKLASVPSLADFVIFNDPHNMEPGTVYVDDAGRRRMAPINISDASNTGHADLKSSESVLGQAHKTLEEVRQIVQAINSEAPPCGVVSQPLSSGYLGRQKMTADDIFYDQKPGVDLLDANYQEDLSLSLSSISAGRRLCVHHLMRYYLRTDIQTVRRRGKTFFAVRPYPKNLVPERSVVSFTLFQADEGGHVRATREDLLKWPEVDNGARVEALGDAPPEDQRYHQFNIPGGLSLVGNNSHNQWDESMLEKYRYLDGDEVLPIYGESDSDNDYDLDTWKEMEEENGTLDLPMRISKRNALSNEDVSQAIDEGTATLVLKWHEHKLPKRLPQAWGIWRKAQREGSRSKLIRDFRLHHDRIDKERLPKMRAEILSVRWTKPAQVREKTRVMEPSIFDREDSRWKISVLESASAPERVPRLKTKAAKKTDQHDSDGEAIESDELLESSEDSMDEFVVDDDLNDGLVPGEQTADADDDDDDQDTDMHHYLDDDDNTPAICFDLNRVQGGVTPISTFASKSQEVSGDMEEIQSHIRRKSDGIHGAEIPESQLVTSLVKQETHAPKVDVVSNSDMSRSNIIDLTISSGDEKITRESRARAVIADVALITPTKPFVHPPSLDERPRPRLRLTFKSDEPRAPTRSESSELEIAPALSYNDKQIAINQPGGIPIENIQRIAELGIQFWIRQDDASRLLIAILFGLPRHVQVTFLDEMTRHDSEAMFPIMIRVLNNIQSDGEDISEADETIAVYTGIIRLYISYLTCSEQPRLLRLSSPHATLVQSGKKLHSFCTLCMETLTALDTYYLGQNIVPKTNDALTSDIHRKARAVADYDEEDSEPVSITRRKLHLPDTTDTSAEECETQQALTPHKVRKRLVKENALASQQRRLDQQRRLEQEQRRKDLHAKLAQFDGSVVAERGRVIINDGKKESEGFVYVHENIAKRIKQHQIEGVRFLWEQIVVNDGSEMQGQGCLLAHTMGLGKTMQVITLLVGIAEASASPDRSVSDVVPEELQVSKTLVICPPTLINNWMDELITWAPEGALGDLRKLDTSIKSLSQRLDIIRDWYFDGGVLVIGYEMLRNLISNKSSKTRLPALSDEEHGSVMKWLLEGPNIIVADEAHKMKNTAASVTKAANRFRSNARIALTGSPLANNVEEYHTMIDWVAPNYLGPIVEFRAKYVEPIQEGLYADSTSRERRQSLKMLGVLKEDLAPKVHRADMSVLRNDLKPKTEYVITIPLTQLQEDSYKIYVRSMKLLDQDTTKDGQIAQTTLWHWLAILSLVCNHPECFRNKLKERTKEANKKKQETQRLGASESDEDATSVPLWKAGVSEAVIRNERELFATVDDIQDIKHSNKVRILCRILDESKAAGDKVLVFSQSLPTLDYLETLCKRTGRTYARLDGRTPMSMRQGHTKTFNTGTTEIYLISTAAGGLGLNLPGANRVIIFDFGFNPIKEEQAIGRAYRIGQQKPVFVYRFVTGGTFEELMHNRVIFKQQLASKVVDKKNPIAYAKKKAGDFLFEPRHVEQKDLKPSMGKDPLVLDKILRTEENIRAVVITDVFEKHDDDTLTAEEQKEVDQLLSDEQLKRNDPTRWMMQKAERDRATVAALAAEMARRQPHVFAKANFSGVMGPQTPILPPRYSASQPLAEPTKFPQNQSDYTPIPSANTQIFTHDTLTPTQTSTVTGPRIDFGRTPRGGAAMGARLKTAYGGHEKRHPPVTSAASTPPTVALTASPSSRITPGKSFISGAIPSSSAPALAMPLRPDQGSVNTHESAASDTLPGSLKRRVPDLIEISDSESNDPVTLRRASIASKRPRTKGTEVTTPAQGLLQPPKQPATPSEKQAPPTLITSKSATVDRQLALGRKILSHRKSSNLSRRTRNSLPSVGTQHQGRDNGQSSTPTNTPRGNISKPGIALGQSLRTIPHPPINPSTSNSATASPASGVNLPTWAKKEVQAANNRGTSRRKSAKASPVIPRTNPSSF